MMSDCPHDPYAQHYIHCLPFGAQPCGALGVSPRTHFRVWAPGRTQVQLELDTGFGPLLVPMTAAGTNWFEVFADCGAGALYRYRLDDAVSIPDPASRSQPEGLNGPSQVVDPRAFTWRNTFWHGRAWEDIALYAIRPHAVGGFDGVRRRLPQLARLGVTALELLASPHDSLPFAPLAAEGGPDALKALIDDAHGYGLAVLLELDYARFGSGTDALRHYAAPFFHTRDDPLQAPPLALDHPEVCDFFCDNALYWIDEYRCDGLRLREADRIGVSWLREIADRVRAAVPADRLIHLVLGSERHPAHLADTHFDAQWNGCGERALHRLTGRDPSAHEGISTHQSIHTLARALTAAGAAFQPAGSGEGMAADSGLSLTSLVLSDGAWRDSGQGDHGQEAGLAALALSLLTPQIPLIFDETARDADRAHFVQSALAVRAKLIAPRLSDCRPQEAHALKSDGDGDADALLASWRLADDETLTIALNLSPEAVPFDAPRGRVVFETPARARDRVDEGVLPPYALVAWLTGDVNRYALTHDARRIDDGMWRGMRPNLNA
ncbi:maltooligosyl trehalose hydrolase [Burkholderia lata]|uniref:Maltooligosyl trehalose hydrolase n=2 Tax=Burkholderia lata (strain ATCC 17760 / DSM 23089 / LMG 22485 / NCIMB 9086 / R18194 / 383) TaxID=482957 RepID=Q393K8_BURL3|nr:maltooligosyl trehalose hydrolase [Burkholderia lata]